MTTIISSVIASIATYSVIQLLGWVFSKQRRDKKDKIILAAILDHFKNNCNLNNTDHLDEKQLYSQVKSVFDHLNQRVSIVDEDVNALIRVLSEKGFIKIPEKTSTQIRP